MCNSRGNAFSLSRIVPVMALLLVAACATGPERRVSDAAGPISAKTRNTLADDGTASLIRAAEGLERSGQFVAAFKIYQQALGVQPGLLAARLGSARTLTLGGQTDTGIALFRTLIVEYPKSDAVRRDYVTALLRANRVVEARLVLMNSSGLSLVEQLQLGILHEIVGETDAARALWDGVNQAAPKDARAGQYLAISFALDGYFETAVELLQDGLNSGRSEVESKRTLAVIYALSGQIDAARNILEATYPYDEVERQMKVLTLVGRMDRREQAMAALLGRVEPETMERLAGS